ncbi:helix-turn-helix domain-containing protein [Streptomyces sp. NBC_00455]|uniref:helix-turn-helix domain-containing protein n=1 Tax=Streptomyces sp. NBC_00455 TaxID=2903654 RepID=UPI002E1DE733
MDTQQVSAPPRASSRDRRGVRHAGVTHINSRHTARFTVVGNHLAQHRGLSLVAIALAVHIQSLPAGARIGVKVLADRFPESEARVASALRELEAHGYLRRTRERLPNGRVVTRTVSYNQPGEPGASGKPVADARPRPTTVPPGPTPPAALSAPEPQPRPRLQPQPRPPMQKQPPIQRQARADDPVPRPAVVLPQPLVPDPVRHRAAIDLLSGLRRDEPRLLLAETDVRRLAPAVAAWLERDAHPDAVRAVLTADLPGPLRRPAALLAHRLAVLVPSPLPALRAGGESGGASGPPDPLQNCDTCDRAFRSPGPGRCRGCRTERRR